jgi:hypothetical protein
LTTADGALQEYKMYMKKREPVPSRIVFCVLTAFVAFIFSACQTTPNTRGVQPGPPYLWGEYEDQVYIFLNRGNLEGQIIILEQDLQGIVSNGKYPPPGLYAQLGLLYAETGNREMAIDFFRKEKSFFPEAVTFMNFLIKRLES